MIAAAFETVWIARLVFLRSGAGGCVLAVDFAPLAPSSFAILRTGDRPRLAAYSLPSIDATCGGSRSRYGRPDPELRLVRIDPLPQHFARGESLQTGLPLDAHEIDGKPVAIAAAAAPAVK